MQIECGHCKTTITFQVSAPKFCSECGSSLSSSGSIQEDVTVARAPGSTASSGSSGDRTHPLGPAEIERLDLETVGPYRLVRKLGQGGMGTVYEASHIRSGRHVALKLLSPEVRGTEEMVQRFRRESQIAASINHPRSTFVYEAGEHDGQLYITMELMDGGTLKDMVAKDGPLPVGQAVDYVIDIIDGLLVAHNAGIVHRDLKPSNSFIDREGRIKVGDFGLAKSFLGDSSLTQTGTFMGTPQYAAPEQIRNEDVNERTDIYALGGTLYYLLTGQAPFQGNPAQVISAIASQTPPRMSEVAKGIPKPLVKLVAQTLEKDPERRPFNLNVVRDALLPFSTRGAMAADPGRRMGAYFLDSLLVAIVGSFLLGLLSPALMFIFTAANLNLHPQLFGIGVYAVAIIMYFAICESRSGRTIGKWLFGLRVVDKKLESPHFLKAFVRAALVPGLLIVIEQSITWWYLYGIDAGQISEVMSTSLKSGMIATVVKWSTMLAIISTARKENGYRAVHDLLTGTRIVRLSGNLESKPLNNSAIIVAVADEDSATLGQYDLLGHYQSNGHPISTHLGLDRQLARPVWLFQGFSENPINEARRHLTRPSRLRIIDQSTGEDGYWYSAESVPGLPLANAIQTSTCPWKSICPLLRDIAYELSLSNENGMIPDNFTISNIWLDHTGQVRILDHPLMTAAEDAVASPSASPRQLAVQALLKLFDLYMDDHEHPVVLIDITDEMRRRDNDPEIFDWLVGQLNETVEKQASWNRIDRAGMMAISLAIELSILSSTIFVAGFLGSWLPPIWQTLIAALASLGVMAALAWFMDGGLAMRLTGVSLRDVHDKTPASRLRLTVRSIIAWLPWAIQMSLLLMAMFAVKETDQEFFAQDMSNFLVPIFAAMIASLIGIAGACFAVINPRRGIPDFLVGTQLMRK